MKKMKGKLMAAVLSITLGILPVALGAVASFADSAPSNQPSIILNQKTKVNNVDTYTVSTYLNDGVTAKDQESAANSHIWLGKTGSSISGTPFYRVLDRDEANSGQLCQMFLVSEYLWTPSFEYGTSNAWTGSNAEAWCSDFYGSAFNSVEKGAIANTEKAETETTTFARQGIGSGPVTLAATPVTGKVFFLSGEELARYFGTEGKDTLNGAKDVSLIAKNSRTGNAGLWWTRSGVSGTAGTSTSVTDDGTINGTDPSKTRSARPALNVDLSKVIFASEAVELSEGQYHGKGLEDNAMKNFKNVTNETDEWKLTLKDNDHFGITIDTAWTADDMIHIKYSGAKAETVTSGGKKYISAVTIDNTGAVTSYGHIAGFTEASGVVSIENYSDLKKKGTLYIFTEEANGDKTTDYACDLVKVDNILTGIDVPSPATDLMYNGSEQVGIPANDGYTLTGSCIATSGDNIGAAVGTEAGLYEGITATLKDGYVWIDRDSTTVPAYKDTRAITGLSFNITKGAIPVPTGEENLAYTGSSQTVLKGNKALYTLSSANEKISIDADTGNAKATNAGTYAITATLVDKDNFKWKLADETTTVNDQTIECTMAPAENEITTFSVADWTYGGNPSTPTVYATHGASTAEFTYSDKEDGTFTSDVPENAGTWYAKATIPAADNWETAEKVTSFEIKKAEGMTASAQGFTGAYDGNEHGITVNVTNPTSGYKVLYSESDVESTFTEDEIKYTGVGTRTVYYKVEANNYKSISGSAVVAINQATNSVNVSLDGWTYEEEANTPECTATFGQDTAVFTYSDSATGTFTSTVPSDAGDWFVKATVPGTDDYAEASAVAGFTISKAGSMNVSASGYNGVYDGKDHSISVSVTYPQSGYTISYSESESGTYTTTNPKYKDAGEHVVYYKVESGNYETKEGSATVNLTQSSNSVSINMPSWTYGEKAKTPSYNATWGKDKAVVTYGKSRTGSFSPTAPKTAGDWFVKVSIPETSNYAAAENIASFNIAKAPLTAAYEGEEITEGVQTPKYDVKVSGFVNGESASTASGYEAPYINEPKTLEPNKTYALTPEGGKADNYSFIYQGGNLVVKRNRAAQTGEGGTVCGPGASLEVAEKAILTSGKDDLPGTAFSALKLRSSKQTKSMIRLVWNAQGGASKYVVYGTRCKTDSYEKLGETRGASFDVSAIEGAKLKKGTYHKFIVVAVDSNNDVVTTSKTIHVVTKGGKNRNHTSVKVTKPKKAKAKMSVGKTQKIKAKAVGSRVKKHVGLRYESTNPAVASVSGNRIYANSPGSCIIFAYAQNGKSKAIKVTVK